jgi:tetratricopeptide (TPR) repeat protein
MITNAPPRQHSRHKRHEPAITSTEIVNYYNKETVEISVDPATMAQKFLEQGRNADAERLFLSALDEKILRLGEEHPETETCLEDICTFYTNFGRHQLALEFAETLLRIRSLTTSPIDDLYNRTVEQLANIYEKIGKPEDAESLYRFLITLQEELVGADNLGMVFALNRLAECYTRQNEFLPALPLYERALAVEEAAYGPFAVETNNTLTELARVYQALGKTDKAAEILKRQVIILESIHGPNGLSVASCLAKMAEVFEQAGNKPEAEGLYQRVTSIYEEAYGANSGTVQLMRRKLDQMRMDRARQQQSGFVAMTPPMASTVLGVW